MNSSSEASDLLAVLREKASDLAVREVVTAVCVVGVETPEQVAYHRCDLAGGDTIQCLDRRFFEPRYAPVLAIHDHFVDTGTQPLSACFASFLRLVESFQSDGDDNG